MNTLTLMHHYITDTHIMVCPIWLNNMHTNQLQWIQTCPTLQKRIVNILYLPFNIEFHYCINDYWFRINDVDKTSRYSVQQKPFPSSTTTTSRSSTSNLNTGLVVGIIVAGILLILAIIIFIIIRRKIGPAAASPLRRARKRLTFEKMKILTLLLALMLPPSPHLL